MAYIGDKKKIINRRSLHNLKLGTIVEVCNIPDSMIYGVKEIINKKERGPLWFVFHDDVSSILPDLFKLL
jgi:hypothetical protein